MVGASRVDADTHFVEDVIAGAAIANLTTFFLVDLIEQNVVIIPVTNTKKHNLVFSPHLNFDLPLIRHPNRCTHSGWS